MHPPTQGKGHALFPRAEGLSPEDVLVRTPRHGYQGDRGATEEPPRVPTHPTLALSRESGARGGTIGRRVAGQLGWAVYDQELLEYMAQDGVVRQGVLDNLSAEASAWVEARLQQLLRQEQLSSLPSFLNLARLVLALGSAGKVVLVGRGCGHILPPDSTINTRIVAPLADRIAYMSNWLRLNQEEAEERVRQRDAAPSSFALTSRSSPRTFICTTWC